MSGFSVIQPDDLYIKTHVIPHTFSPLFTNVPIRGFSTQTVKTSSLFHSHRDMSACKAIISDKQAQM